jgi:hypothetical protein
MKPHLLLMVGASFALFSQHIVADTPVRFEVKWASTQGPAIPTYLSISSRDRWVEFWKQLKIDQERFIHGATPTVDEAPEIDFSRVTLILAGAGTKPTGGFSISIQNIVETENDIRVTVVETELGRCAGTTISTAPFVGAAIPVTTKRISFEVTKAVPPACR